METLTRFGKAVRYVLEQEDGVRWDHDTGCYTYNPHGHSDPPTKWGVILEEYQKYFGGTWTPEMVQAATREQALVVYQKKFWIPIKGDAYLEESHAIAIMDTAVNKGLWGCKQILQHMFGKQYQGEAWVFGSDLVGDVNKVVGQSFLDGMALSVKWYIDKHIAENPGAEWARAGWTNRANRIPAISAWSPQ